MIMKGRVISPGKAEGEAIVSKIPISFFGSVDAKTGKIIEKGHTLEGRCLKDKIFVFPFGRGSTVGSYVIYGLARNGVAPKAIINEETETITATGAILAGIPCIDGINTTKIKDGSSVKVDCEKGLVEFGEQV